MKKLVAILFFCSMHLCGRSQQKNIPILDTLELPKIELKKMVLIQENATMLISSDTNFLTFLNTLKFKVFDASYLKHRRNDIKSAIKIIKRQLNQIDTITINDKLKHQIGLPLLYSYLGDMIENKKLIIIDAKDIQHLKIIREKSSYQKDALDGWGGRKYYLPNSKTFFLIVTDWVS
jgi:hypothetical protein